MLQSNVSWKVSKSPTEREGVCVSKVCTSPHGLSWCVLPKHWGEAPQFISETPDVNANTMWTGVLVVTAFWWNLCVSKMTPLYSPMINVRVYCQQLSREGQFKCPLNSPDLNLLLDCPALW